MKRKDSFDIAKLILSLMVVMIHVNPVGGGIDSIVFPVVRIAVPLFFMMSSYFFFGKISNQNQQYSVNALKKYVFRLSKLYLAWFLVLLPYTLWFRDYFSEGIMNGLLSLLRGVMLWSTFRASWYISATIIGTVLVYLLSKIASNRIIILMGGLLYLLCSLLSNYSGISERLPVFVTINKVYPYIWNSFPVSILWIALGKCFAERQHKPISMRALILVISLVLLFVENYLGKRFGYIIKDNDCYILLIPTCIILFDYLLSWDVQINHGKEMRASSTIFYCLHTSMGALIGASLKRLGITTLYFPGATVVYILTIFGCFFFTAVILILERNKKWNWVKIFH